MSVGSHRGLGLAPAVERQRLWGWRAEQLIASMADSQRMTKMGRFLILTDLRPGSTVGSMARKLRVEYPGAIYHVMSGRDRREAIFLENLV